MRLTLLASILAVGLMHHETILEEASRWLAKSDPAEVRAALELRCGEAAGPERKNCEADLRESFARGTSDAGTIVRLHCTHFDNGWSEDRGPSAICASFQEG